MSHRVKAGYTEEQCSFLDATNEIIREYIEKEMFFEPVKQGSYKTWQEGLEERVRSCVDMSGIESFYIKFSDDGNPSSKVSGIAYTKFLDSQFWSARDIVIESTGG